MSVVETFLNSPTFEELSRLKKDSIVDVATALGLEPKRSMRKPQLVKIVAEHMIDNDIFEEDVLDNLVSDSPGLSHAQIELERIKIEANKAIEMEKARVELEKAKMEQETRRQEIEDRRTFHSERRNEFDLTKQVRLVPAFNEADVDNYFQHFEKIASSLNWPLETWTLLLQTVLKGKAQEIYASLSAEDCSDYNIVKSAILRSYEMVPEAYRQKFRGHRKDEKQTFVEFFRQKEVYFDRWCAAKSVGTDHDKLRQLMLIEEFRRCVHDDLKVYLNEKQVDTAYEMATLADEYALTHKRGKSRSNDPFADGSGTNPRMVASAGPSMRSIQINNRNRPDSSTHKTHSPNSQQAERWKTLTCHYCGKVGHIAVNCSARKKDAENRGVPSNKPQGFIASHRSLAKVNTDKIREEYRPFVSDGSVCPVGDPTEKMRIKILRDTGATQSLILSNHMPRRANTATGESVIIQGVGNGFVSVPLHKVTLESDIVRGTIEVGVVDDLPMKGVAMLLGNDLAGKKVSPPPLKVATVPSTPASADKAGDSDAGVYPACVVTRARAQKEARERRAETSSAGRGTEVVNLSQTCLGHEIDVSPKPKETPNKNPSTGDEQVAGETSVSWTSVAHEQRKDSEIAPLFREALDEEELDKVPSGYFVKDGTLMRKWRPSHTPALEDWSTVQQLVLPRGYREEVLRTAHETPMGGHMGIRKTHDRITRHFYWPGIRGDVASYCKTCHTCQMVGKPNQRIPNAPLHPIPAFEEPFCRILVDCVGPLPKTKRGNEHILTIMCASTRFPEAIPLRNISAGKITKALITFFSMVGLPKVVQSDQGSNFMSKVFQQAMSSLGITTVKSSAYHPQSQGALERFHSTLKSMVRTYCFDHHSDWDEGLPFLMFAARDATQESLGFSPFELVFGHSVRGPLSLLKDKWMQESRENRSLLDYVSRFRTRLQETSEIAQERLKSVQGKMKRRYDRNTVPRTFEAGDKVLVLLPISGQPLKARFHGPYEIARKASDLNYVVKTPDRRKATQMCHVNMIKPYYQRDDGNPVLAIVRPDCGRSQTNTPEESVGKSDHPMRLRNSDILADLTPAVIHLDRNEKEEMINLIRDFRELFPDTPKQVPITKHDVDVGNATPVKQHPYRVNPQKAEVIRQEVEYMLEHGIIEPSQSSWSSPCVLVAKPDGSVRFCTDYRKVNSLTRTDSHPIPRMDDCIDRVGRATYITKLDLLKGYWCVPLTERAKSISAFATPQGLYQYRVMPFGMKNSQATFQRMMNHCLRDLPNVETYIDDIVIYNDNWPDHVASLRKVFDRLLQANLTINLSKSEFGKAEVTYLGHTVGYGKISPLNAKIQSILDVPAPTNVRSLRRFLGMAGYYRKFCRNFSDVASPLTQLLSKKSKFTWTSSCQKSFEQIRSLLCSDPVLRAPDFQQPFRLAIDASDHGIGSVLLQTDPSGIEHPVSYFSRKFNSCQKNYSTVEKETLALILSLQHFDVYISSSSQPTIIYTDHNPLTFLHRMKSKNRRLLSWSLFLQEYDLDIRHIRGVDNVCADTLSRV